jgi:cytochrome P450
MMMESTHGVAPSVIKFDPLSAEYLVDPAPSLKQVQRDNPVFYYEPLKCWIVTKYEDLRAALRDAGTFSSRATGFIRPPPDLAPLVPDLSREEIIITLDPPAHNVHRNTMMRGFLSTVINRMEGTVRTCANSLIDRFIDAGQADLMAEFCLPLTMNSILTILGVPPEHKALYRQWTEDFFFLLTPRVLNGSAPAELRIVEDQELRERWGRLAEANHFFAEYVAKRKSDPGEDIISAMLQVTDADGQPIIEQGTVVLHLISLIGAGHDTTANTIAHLVKNLSDFPTARDQIVADPGLIPNAVEEGLRMRGSVPGNFRVTTADVRVRGVTIPANSLVYLLVAAGGHDEEVFPGSLKFDIRRQNASKHLAFGFGRHTCIGNALARLQARIAIEELYRRIPSLTVAPGFKPEYLPLMTVTGLLGLDVQWATAAQLADQTER